MREITKKFTKKQIETDHALAYAIDSLPIDIKTVTIYETNYEEWLFENADGFVYLYDIWRHFTVCYKRIEDCLCPLIPKDEKDFARLFGLKMFKLMDLATVNQKMLSEITGISEAAISYYITGKRLPGLHNAKIIADALRVTVDEMLYFDVK